MTIFIHVALKADSKAVIDRICQAAFAYRHVTDVPTTAIESISSDLKIDQSESVKVCSFIDLINCYITYVIHFSLILVTTPT